VSGRLLAFCTRASPPTIWLRVGQQLIPGAYVPLWAAPRARGAPSSTFSGTPDGHLPVRSARFCENKFGILLWNLFELFEGLESVFLSSGFQRLVNSGEELACERGGFVRLGEVSFSSAKFVI